MMDLFKILPENFFSILCSKYSQIYCDALVITHKAVSNTYNLKKDDLAAMLVEQLQDVIMGVEIEDDEEEAPKEKTLSAQAYSLIRKLRWSGWLNIEYLPNSFDEYIIMEDYARKFVNLFLDITNMSPKEYNGCKMIDEVTIPQLVSNINNLKMQNGQKYTNQNWVANEGSPEYIKAITVQRNTAKLTLIYTEFIENVNINMKNLKIEIEKKMIRYNEMHHMSFAVYPENTMEYSLDLKRLVDTELPQYEEEIRESKRQAYEQFRDEFIGKLQSNIYSARVQVEELNHALRDIKFKGHYYEFVIKPNPDYEPYYRMITDPLFYTGFSVSSPELLKQHGDTLESLFKNITDSADETMDHQTRKNIEGRMKIFADYRTYLSFDLRVNKGKEEENESLAARFTKKSGGESQTPFYICILASFVRTYMMNQSEAYSNTIRLVIFDEAFSKMDDKHVPECMKLLKKFKFQAIVSAPSSKIGEMSPLVDKTILVMTRNNETSTLEFDNKQVRDLLEA